MGGVGAGRVGVGGVGLGYEGQEDQRGELVHPVSNQKHVLSQS